MVYELRIDFPSFDGGLPDSSGEFIGVVFVVVVYL